MSADCCEIDVKLGVVQYIQFLALLGIKRPTQSGRSFTCTTPFFGANFLRLFVISNHFAFSNGNLRHICLGLLFRF